MRIVAHFFERFLEGSGYDRRSAAARAISRLVAVSAIAVPALLVWLGAPSLASAEAPTPERERSIYTRDGVYMGGRGVYNVSDFDLDKAKALELGAPPSGIIENGWGFGLNVGYRTHRLFAGEIDMEILDPGFELNGAKLGSLGMTLYAKVYPLGWFDWSGRAGWLNRFQPYVKMGPGFQYFHTSGTADPAAPDLDGVIGTVGFVGRLGGGLEFYLTKQLAMTFDTTYTIGVGAVEGLNYTALGVVGLQWRFSPK